MAFFYVAVFLFQALVILLLSLLGFVELWHFLSAMAVLLLLVVFVKRRFFVHQQIFTIGRACCVLFLVTWTGSIFLQKMHTFQNIQSGLLEQKSLWIYGKLSDIPIHKRTHNAYEFLTSKIDADDFNQTVSFRLSDYRKQRVLLNTKTHYAIKIKPKPIYSNNEPDVFNYSTYLFSNGIQALGYIQEIRPIETSLTLKDGLLNWRERIAQQLNALENNGFLYALVLGNKSYLNAEDKDTFSKTGLMHVLVISGLHIGLAFLFFYSLVHGIFFLVFGHKMGRFYHVSKIVILLLVFLYLGVSGMNIPGWRAWLMLLFYMLSGWFGASKARLLDGLHFAGMTMLLFMPIWFFSVSFWLSYWAVLGVLLFMQRINWRVFGFKKYTLHVVQLFGLSIFLSLWLLPVLSYLGISYGIFSGFLNTAIVLLFSWVLVPLLLLGLLLFLVFPEGALWVWSLVLEALVLISGYLSQAINVFWPLWEVRFSFWSMLLWCILGVVFWFLRFNKQRFMVLLALLVVLMVPDQSVKQDEVAIHVLDIKHGLSVLIQTKNHQLLFDTGYKKQTNFVVIPKLKKLGVTRLDALIISHADADHAGGRKNILKEFDVQDRYAGDKNLLPGQVRCNADQSWVWDGVRFSFLYPWDGVVFKDRNSHSCVLMVETGQQRFLITADIGFEQEKALLNKRNMPAVQTLIVPHQGSRYSSGAPWLAFHKNTLENAIIVHKRFNSYKHPAVGVVEGYRSLGARVYGTGCLGGLYVAMNPQETRVQQGWLWPWERSVLPAVC